MNAEEFLEALEWQHKLHLAHEADPEGVGRFAELAGEAGLSDSDDPRDTARAVERLVSTEEGREAIGAFRDAVFAADAALRGEPAPRLAAPVPDHANALDHAPPEDPRERARRAREEAVERPREVPEGGPLGRGSEARREPPSGSGEQPEAAPPRQEEPEPELYADQFGPGPLRGLRRDGWRM